MNLTDGEKLMLVMLSDIHKGLNVESEIDPAFVKEALQSGNAWGLRWKYPGIFEAEETPRETVREVVDVLGMWHAIEYRFGQLSAADKEAVRTRAELGRAEPRFAGFDGNSEPEHLVTAAFLIERLDRFGHFKDRDLNSHMRSLEMHRRMVAVYEAALQASGYAEPLTAEQLIQILREKVHPSNRAGTSDART